jgi:FkbM family methyltransferase
MRHFHVHASCDLFGAEPAWPFKLLAHVPPGLAVDVGAAAGAMTSRILENSPESTVVAYEPFPGNWPHFEKRWNGDPRVTLIKKAAAETIGTAHFSVSSTVQGTEAGWEAMQGYSSLGRLAERPTDRTIKVDTDRIDKAISEPVRFLKIDVQGSELAVVKGCERLLKKEMIDLLYVEFDGVDTRAAQRLMERGYLCFDTSYRIVRQDGDTKPPHGSWDIIDEHTLSNGRVAWCAWPMDCPRTLGAYAGWMCDQRRMFRNVWTDLVFVRSGYLAKFFHAASAMLEQDRESQAPQ